MDRAQRTSHQIDELEREYLQILTAALTACAEGQWGLFGHNEHIRSYKIPVELVELRRLAQVINGLRARIGDGPFPLHEQFEASRGPADPNDPGEPTQARAWLNRLCGT